jgi:putative endonuclease
MKNEKIYYVYLLTSISRRALYTGVTNGLMRRLVEHRELQKGFTAQYKALRLVHFERFAYIDNAIAREKEIKGWTRAKKNKLVIENNPGWVDLSVAFGLDAWPPVSQ